MFKFFSRILILIFLGCLLSFFIPIQFFAIAGIVLLVLVVVLFILFHLGVQDFQGYES